jgi:hypothetical protein
VNYLFCFRAPEGTALVCKVRVDRRGAVTCRRWRWQRESVTEKLTGVDSGSAAWPVEDASLEGEFVCD